MNLKSKFTLTLIFSLVIIGLSAQRAEMILEESPHDLIFSALPDVWDEGIPLGNGMVGALVWKKEGKLRLSLDRVDLWDLRPMENEDTRVYNYQWVYDQWKKDDYKPVQDRYDAPYNRSPAPSKIPGAALEFDISSLGEVESVHLNLATAICKITWESGVRFYAYVHAEDPVGWFRFEGLDKEVEYELIPPAYNLAGKSGIESPVTGQDLRRLEYPEGEVEKNGGQITYNQEGWGGFKYQVHVLSDQVRNGQEGMWSISSEFPGWKKTPSAIKNVSKSIENPTEFHRGHKEWWKNYWSKSSIDIPDAILEKQWYLEQYKFASAAQVGAPPISLQAVWTADNGKLPPWKGDFHHDLNTQLSYWSSYSGNHLDLEIGYLDWLWKYRKNFKNYTKDYFGTEGLNVPGVTTLTGQPMGGWIQYAFGPTVSAWLGQHFYLHWKYSMDEKFLKKRAYPWIKDVAIFIDQVSIIGDNGMRKLPISASPELNDNDREAWFGETTNFDLAAIRFTYKSAAEMATALGKKKQAAKWKAKLAEWPTFAISKETGLQIAPGFDFDHSHRHFSHLLSYHPLGLVDFSNGEEDQKIIKNTLRNLDKLGSRAWVGYSFAWQGNLRARAFDGDGAAEVLRIFATSFCLPNSFHVNGDQSGKGYSGFTYRPFTLEGNFAFAAGIQEMLLQSHTGVVHVFPAIPKNWTDLSFNQLRAQGAFLISATKADGEVKKVIIEAENGGKLVFKNPFLASGFKSSADYKMIEDNIVISSSPGQVIVLDKQ